MLVNNGGGLPQGDTDNPELIAQPRGGTPAVIDTREGLEKAARALAQGSTPIALDVERAQGFRYGSDPYLVQIRREDVGSFLIDTHALPDLSVLQPGVEDVWLLHDCLQDLPNLRQVGLRPSALFDTEIAARLVGLERFGLAAVAEQVLGLGLVKDHQASDWSVRPLPKEWLRYAALDVELLTELYYRLSKRLDQMGRWEWAQQEFAHALSVKPPTAKPVRAEVWVSSRRCGRPVSQSRVVSTCPRGVWCVTRRSYVPRRIRLATSVPSCPSTSSAPPSPDSTRMSGCARSRPWPL